MYLNSIYFGLKVVLIWALWGQSIYCLDTWTLRDKGYSTGSLRVRLTVWGLGFRLRVSVSVPGVGFSFGFGVQFRVCGSA